MKNVITLVSRCYAARMWNVTDAKSAAFDAGRSDRQQRYREREPSDGQL